MLDLPDMLDQEAFEHLVRDGLANLFDHAALETHPLAALCARGQTLSISRAAFLRETLEKAIEHLRPDGDNPNPYAPEWRPYLILRWRYVDGARLQEIQERLALSERQLRREHSRSLQAVAALLWDQLYPDSIQASSLSTGSSLDFPVTLGPLNLDELVKGVEVTLQNRIASEGLKLDLNIDHHIPPVLSDRVILRQILIRLTRYAFNASLSDHITISSSVESGNVQLKLAFQEEELPALPAAEQRNLDELRFWAERINASLERRITSDRPVTTSLVISLPRADQPVLLVVDDQETAHRMYRRYLSRSSVRMVSLQDGGQAVETARREQPNAIILDVMIPNVDGWEVLQALRANPQTCHIPVIICTVWEEPELAYSLGADEFLKKPFSQKDFLAVLGRLGLF